MHALTHVHDVQDNLRAVRSKFALNPAGNGIFGCGDRGAKNRHQYTPKPAETKIQEVSGRESPQKGPIWCRIENARFAEGLEPGTR